MTMKMTPEGIAFNRAQEKLGILNTIDWCDGEAVVTYAKTFGRGMTVYRHPNRPNFNITHTSRTDLYQPSWVYAHLG